LCSRFRVVAGVEEDALAVVLARGRNNPVAGDAPDCAESVVEMVTRSARMRAARECAKPKNASAHDGEPDASRLQDEAKKLVVFADEDAAPST